MTMSMMKIKIMMMMTMWMMMTLMIKQKIMQMKMKMTMTIKVDERYASIPAPAWTQRSEKSEHMVITESSLGAWSDYIRSWSGFQQMSMQAGEQAADHLISSFLDTCRKSLDLPSSRDPHKISLRLATQYWVTVYQK